MAETLFEELKRYVRFGPADEQALRALRPLAAPEFTRIAESFYARILSHEGARKALESESQVGRLKVTLVAWMDKLLSGPWDEDYYELRARIGRVHVRIALPQHYMMAAMNVLRQELDDLIDRHYLQRPEALRTTRAALAKMLDLELAIMLHTYREDLLSQQARAERLSTFGQLVGSIGHELRNPLGVIESSVFILRGRVAEDERAAKHVNRIAEQVSLANDIISKLLDMIRDRPVAKEPIDLEALARDSVAAVTWPSGVELVLTGFAGMASVPGDAVQLRQVLVNLLENAAHAVSSPGHVTLSAARVEGAVQLAVEDDGPGIDPSIRGRLFEPLTTTKAKGIGLGLALVKRIVERHGGTIQNQPVAPHGARFILTLPAAAS